MGKLLLGFIPLALAAITPAMLAVVFFLLSLDRGRSRAIAFMAGRQATYAAWSVALFTFTDRAFDLTSGSHSDFTLLLKAILGLFLIAIALKISLGGDDPEALPSKILETFDRLSPLHLFGLGFLVSIFQVRHILLLFVGVTEIILAELSAFKTVLAALILIVMINASPLLIIGIDLTLSGRTEVNFHTVEVWLTQNNRRIAVLLGIIGVYLIWNGVSHMMVFG